MATAAILDMVWTIVPEIGPKGAELSTVTDFAVLHGSGTTCFSDKRCAIVEFDAIFLVRLRSHMHNIWNTPNLRQGHMLCSEVKHSRVP